MNPFVDKAFLGVGWSFPIATDETGAITLSAYEEDIRQAVLIILETAEGERVMRPDFGAGLRALMFEPLNTTTIALVKHRVERALITWEPRIDQLEIDVIPGGDGFPAAAGKRNGGRVARAPIATPSGGTYLDIEIRYRVRATNTFYNLVYPFYLQEGK
jgi:phage baseplate assembly protein W